MQEAYTLDPADAGGLHSEPQVHEAMSAKLALPPAAAGGDE